MLTTRKDEDEVAFISHIAEELAKERNQTFKFAMYHIIFLKDWLQHLILNPKIHCIKLFSLGRMYRSLPVTKNIYRKLVRAGNRYEATANRKESVKMAIEDLESRIVESNKFNVHRAKSRINKSFHTLSKSKKELEEFQNNKDE